MREVKFKDFHPDIWGRKTWVNGGCPAGFLYTPIKILCGRQGNFFIVQLGFEQAVAADLRWVCGVAKRNPKDTLSTDHGFRLAYSRAIENYMLRT